MNQEKPPVGGVRSQTGLPWIRGGEQAPNGESSTEQRGKQQEQDEHKGNRVWGVCVAVY